MLDPACGDGQFLRLHHGSVGVELSAEASQAARFLAPHATVHRSDFFEWAEHTDERFDAIVGNPPFIRYQLFSGATRQRALRLAARAGACFTGLTSSWAPFVAVSSTLLAPGGRMAFVVPAEIGHAPYAVPLLEALSRRFDRLYVIAIKEKVFPDLSEDAWLLLAFGYGGSTQSVRFAAWDHFRAFTAPPRCYRTVPLSAWRAHGHRLRKFLFPDTVLDYYLALANHGGCSALGRLARVGIGYVTGANDFFHLRPSQAEDFGIPHDCMTPAIRKGEQLPETSVTPSHVAAWLAEDRAILLLHLAGKQSLPPSVRAYLDTPMGQKARGTYKCRNRRPWYAVPDVTVPHAFLSYMSGDRPSLVWNRAGCVCTNSIHAVHFGVPVAQAELLVAWNHPVCDLSKELEGHPLGGGMLKHEPREARRILLPLSAAVRQAADLDLINQAVLTAREWRHYGNGSS